MAVDRTISYAIRKLPPTRHMAQRAEYAEYRAESRACGYEVESFEQWLGETSLRGDAELRANYEMEYGA